MVATPVVVRAGQDRTQSRNSLWGIMPFGVKVGSCDADGASVAFEIDGDQHTLRPGDTLLVPRGEPHGWAYTLRAPRTWHSRKRSCVRTRLGASLNGSAP